MGTDDTGKRTADSNGHQKVQRRFEEGGKHSERRTMKGFEMFTNDISLHSPHETVRFKYLGRKRWDGAGDELILSLKQLDAWIETVATYLTKG